MERGEVDMISKKRRLDSVVAGDVPNHEGEGSSKIVETQSSTVKVVDDVDVVYKLYFKGLVSNEIAATAIAGLGVAICDEADKLLFELKEPVSDSGIDSKGVEIKALIRGLSESLAMGIKNVVIYCDDYQIYQNITGRCNHKEKGVNQQLMGEIRGLRQQFASSEATLVARTDIKFAFKLAKEAIVSQTTGGVIDVKAAQEGEICVICLEKTNVERIFCIEKCLHRHCFSCVKQFVEVKLLSGNVPKCLDNGCNIELTPESCSKVLTRKLIELWKYKMKEDAIPATEKIYCPYPNCSTLMSKADLSVDQTNVRACVKCSGLFCIDCKVPSHPDLSCAEYKKLHPEPLVEETKLKSLAKDENWRQCVKCRHMIELSQGCNHMTCRCGYEFCYKCGVEWKKGQTKCPSGCTLTDHDNDDGDNPWDYDEYNSDGNHDDNDGDNPWNYDEVFNYGCGCDCDFGRPDSPPRRPRPEDFFDHDEYFDYCYGL